ncbi:MAG: TIGR03790 family protein, partial [Pseudomonadota bacterium]|nr:TIGR03790 family protein [Pseudomonadota bacterium]
LIDHYLNGETLIEAYWKSVASPGQGLFVGEPLARPFGLAPRSNEGDRM